MNIIKSLPPNFAEIVKVFPIARKPTVIFAHAPDIYNPAGMPLPKSLIEHEGVHIKRQEIFGVRVWWDLYLTNDQFRFDEELLAHRREYEVLASQAATHKRREVALKMVAKKLASPLYGRMVNTDQAMRMISA